ncbi:TPA: hypothetical protein N0F65_012449 [Lagenidium giganteum]|uniref:Endonuclease/exonuclease/phosphatase family domain-containing protein 1 n=1 Tax=Lagenidium giganteum TaxID=4803 RepID=A0AAV2YF27_9STRA|nr:TPA: hypothetical protein N0F65_012449 [Lagenidium giganteum]
MGFEERRCVEHADAATQTTTSSSSSSHKTRKACPVRVDVNHATTAELQYLPGVGPVVAAAIVHARPFQHVQDLRHVRGIGPRRFEQIAPLVAVQQSSADHAASADVSSSTADLPGRSSTSRTCATFEQIAPLLAVQQSSADHAASADVSSSTAVNVNVNQATPSVLQHLRGVGPVLAARIVEARPFHSVDDLLSVHGIGERVLARMQPQIAVTLPSEDDDSAELASAEHESLPEAAPRCVLVHENVRNAVWPTTTWNTHRSSSVLVASWNVRNFSKRRETMQLNRVASVVEQFDIVAMQEVRDMMVLKRLKVLLPGWDFAASVVEKEARVTPEFLVYFFRRSVVRLKRSYSLSVPAQSTTRPPFVAHFQAHNDVSDSHNLVLVNVHVAFRHKDDRRVEARVVERLVEDLDTQTMGNAMVMGDFNLAPHELGRFAIRSAAIRSPASTTVFGKLYDNIWMPSAVQKRLHGSGVYRIDWRYYPRSKHQLRGGDTTERLEAQMARFQCALELSDHCPCFVAIAAPGTTS